MVDPLLRNQRQVMLTALVQDGFYNAFIGLVRTSTNRRILVYRKGVAHIGDDGIVVCRKSSGIGQAYSGESTVLADSPREVRDPEIQEITLANGDKRLIVSCFVHRTDHLLNGVRIVTSDDDGDTWSSAMTLTSSFALWSCCSAKVVQLPNGDLLLPCYGTDASDMLVEVQRSTDYGATWTPSRPFASITDTGLQEPNIVILQNGDLLMTVRTNADNTYESISTDSGATWSALSFATTDYGRPHILQLPDGRVGMIQRHQNTTRAVLYHRTDGVWSSPEFLHADLLYRMTYASSVIDENGDWEIVVAQEPSGTVSDIYGLTRLIALRHIGIQVGALNLLFDVKD